MTSEYDKRDACPPIRSSKMGYTLYFWIKNHVLRKFLLTSELVDRKKLWGLSIYGLYLKGGPLWFVYLQTVRFKNELERNITIKLGYANAKIYKCEDERCPRPMCYKYADI